MNKPWITDKKVKKEHKWFIKYILIELNNLSK